MGSYRYGFEQVTAVCPVGVYRAASYLISEMMSIYLYETNAYNRRRLPRLIKWCLAATAGKGWFKRALEIAALVGVVVLGQAAQALSVGEVAEVRESWKTEGVFVRHVDSEAEQLSAAGKDSEFARRQLALQGKVEVVLARCIWVHGDRVVIVAAVGLRSEINEWRVKNLYPSYNLEIPRWGQTEVENHEVISGGTFTFNVCVGLSTPMEM